MEIDAFVKPATHLAIFYADRRDRRKSPVVPGAAIAIFAAILHEFSKLPHRRDRRKKSPGVSASIGGENRLRFSLAINFAAIGA